jgi:ribosome-associated toxin RatA of RatAB toxin-antitoxin module
MPHVNSSCVIASGPELIWALVSDPEQYPELVPAARPETPSAWSSPRPARIS